jgi:hypothetical protein
MGMLAAEGELIVFTDAAGSYRPTELVGRGGARPARRVLRLCSVTPSSSPSLLALRFGGRGACPVMAAE